MAHHPQRSLQDLRVGQILELLVTGAGADGEGVGRAPDGRAVFVPRAALGERLRVRLVHLGTRRLTAEPLEVLQASPDRVAAPCPVFGRCGGCQLMHLGYPAQLDFKRTVLLDALRSLAGFQPPAPLAVRPAAHPLGYRNRGQYPLALRRGRVVSGFFAPRSHRVVAVERCLLHDERVDRAVGVVRAWAERHRVPIYDERSGRGWLRHVVARCGSGAAECQVALVGTRPRPAGLAELVQALRRELPDLAGLAVNLQPAATNVVLGPDTRLVWGRGWVEERLLGLRFRLSVGTFFQVHTAMAEALFTRVRSFAAGAGGPIVDAYSGVGVLAQVLAAAGAAVVAIEVVSSAVADGRRSARHNRLPGIEWHAGEVEEVLPRLVERGLRPALAVLDPPRKGCDQAVLDALGRAGVPRLAYVSCHPGTLARDLARLFELGYRVTALEAFDMFPQTAHLETFVGLERMG